MRHHLLKEQVYAFCMFALLVAAYVFPPPAAAHEGKRHGGAAATQAFPPAVTAQDALKTINDRYVREIKPIFRRSCFNCHSSQSSPPWYYFIPGVKQLIDHDIREARKHIDMTFDFPFKGHGSPKEDLTAIRKSIEKDLMPPFRYRIMHHEAALSDTEKELVRRWAADGLAHIAPASFSTPF